MKRGEQKQLTPATWEEFRAAGLLWWLNRSLHLFGWAIVTNVDSESGKVLKAYPARIRVRGFARKDEEEGFEKLTRHLSGRWGELEQDLELENE